TGRKRDLGRITTRHGAPAVAVCDRLTGLERASDVSEDQPARGIALRPVAPFEHHAFDLRSRTRRATRDRLALGELRGALLECNLASEFLRLPAARRGLVHDA